MNRVFRAVFLVGWAVYLFGVYRRSVRRYLRKTIAVERTRGVDLLLDAFIFIGWQVLPVICVLTPWMGFADYHLPAVAGWAGVAVFALALWLLWRAYADLGSNWSPKLDIRQEQVLVTDGVYGFVRHPIYAGIGLWGIAQPLLIQNWIAAWALLVLFIPLCLMRIPREESMMLEHYGEAYRSYMKRTRGLMPRLTR